MEAIQEEPWLPGATGAAAEAAVGRATWCPEGVLAEPRRELQDPGPCLVQWEIYSRQPWLGSEEQSPVRPLARAPTRTPGRENPEAFLPCSPVWVLGSEAAGKLAGCLARLSSLPQLFPK